MVDRSDALIRRKFESTKKLIQDERIELKRRPMTIYAENNVEIMIEITVIM